MNAPTQPNAQEKRSRRREKRGRRRAILTMRIVTVVCALSALGIGASQLASTGVQAFLDRPPGVGATPANTSTKRQPASSAQSGSAASGSPTAPATSPPQAPSGPADPPLRGEQVPPARGLNPIGRGGRDHRG
jgi:hypothetical protein